MKPDFYEQNADDFGYITLLHGHDNRTSAHFHNSIEILFVAEGEFTVRGNGEERILIRGDIFFADNFVTHLYKNGKDPEYYVMVISDMYMNNFRAVYGNYAFPMFMAEKREQTAPLFAALQKAYAEWNEYNTLMKHGFADTILGMLARIYPPQPAKPHKESLFIADVLRYIDSHFAEELSLVSVAAHFGYSPNYFSMLFHRYTDMNFREYLGRVRVRETNSLLRGGDISLAKAASLCGFVSLNTYYRALKNQTETQPES